MHSRFRISDVLQYQHEGEESSSAAHQMMLSSPAMNQPHHDEDILEQIRRGGAPAQPLFMNNVHHHNHPFPPPPQHHHLPARSNHGHYYAAPSPSSLFPLNFKLGLDSDNNNVEEELQQRRRIMSSRTSSYYNDNNEVGRGLVLPRLHIHGSEQYEEAVPETSSRHTVANTSLGMLHCWQQNQEDSAIKQPPLWEAEVSNENSEIVDRHDNNSDKNNSHVRAVKSGVNFAGELEAIYKRLGSADESDDQTGPIITEPVNTTNSFPLNHMLDHGSENSIGGENDHEHHGSKKESASIQKKGAARKRKKIIKEKKDAMIDPMTEFFGNLVKQVMEHQENLHRRFAEAVERLDWERRKREEAWRSQELAHFERQAMERARERDLAESREATVISYLEKITGEKINLPPKFDPTSS